MISRLSHDLAVIGSGDIAALIGRVEPPRRIIDELPARRNHLLSENIGSATGTLWGNVPRTTFMVGLVAAATRSSKGPEGS